MASQEALEPPRPYNIQPWKAFILRGGLMASQDALEPPRPYNIQPWKVFMRPHKGVSHQFPSENQARNHCHQKVMFLLVFVVFLLF